MAQIYLRSLYGDLYSAANDPQIETQIIPELYRKFSRRKTKNGMDFGFLEIFYFFENLCLLTR